MPIGKGYKNIKAPAKGATKKPATKKPMKKPVDKKKKSAAKKKPAANPYVPANKKATEGGLRAAIKNGSAGKGKNNTKWRKPTASQWEEMESTLTPLVWD